MNEHRQAFSLVLMCRVLKVARAGFYQWQHQPVSKRAKEDARLVEVIRDSYSASGDVYASIAPNRLNREFTVDAPDQAWSPK
jgi:putative transposase